MHPCASASSSSSRETRYLFINELLCFEIKYRDHGMQEKRERVDNTLYNRVHIKQSLVLCTTSVGYCTSSSSSSSNNHGSNLLVD